MICIYVICLFLIRTSFCITYSENCLMRCSSLSWQMSSVLSFSAMMYPSRPCTTTFFSCVVCIRQFFVSNRRMQVLPIARFGSRFQKVAVFHEYHVGIEHLGEFFAIFWIEGVASSITFSNDNGRTVETYM